MFTKFTHARLLLPDGLRRGSLAVREGRICRIFSSTPKTFRSGFIHLRGGYLAPGFVDLHVHGALGHLAMEATPASLRTITEFHLRGGTTSINLTSIAAKEREILFFLEEMKRWRNRSLGDGARIVGVHLEGPFLSPKRPGAQNSKEIRNPRFGEWKKYLRFGKLITQMTLAPEVKGATELIRALKRNGSIISGGHTDATEDELYPALRAGLNHSTHTFNAMSGVRKIGALRKAGMIEFALAEKRISCELISDGCHVPPVLMKMLFNAKGRDGVCLITDATHGAGLKPGTKFKMGPYPAIVTPDTAVLQDGRGLAGSTLTMIEAIRRAVRLADIPLTDAVRMASLNPARQLGRDREFGSLEEGKRADLVWFDDAFRVRGVWLDGVMKFLT